MKNILVLTDFSDNAKSAERYALQLAIKNKANLLLYNAYTQQPNISGNVVWPHDEPLSMELQCISQLELRASELKAELNFTDSTSFQPEVRHTCNEGSLSKNLLDVVCRNNVWLIIMGTKGEGFANNFLFGSNVFKVLDKSCCPVLIVPQNAELKDVAKIAYATDLKSDDLLIFKWLSDLSENLQTQLLIVHFASKMLSKEENDISRKITQRSYEKEFSTTYTNSFQLQNIEDSLHEIADQKDIDILALLHRQHGFFDRFFHGSVSHKMIKDTKLPVLIFPDTEKKANGRVDEYSKSVLHY